MRNLTNRFVLLATVLLLGFTAQAQTPPATWQEHWFEHNQLLNRVYYDNDLAVYYDNNVSPTVTWPFQYMGDVWRYTKSVYGNYGTENRLYAVFHTGRYSGGHPSTYFDAGHDNRNVTDCGPGPWTNGTGNDLDLTTHEVAHIVEGASKGVHGAPHRVLWGDSKWAEIFNYDVYLGLGRTADATRWYNLMIVNSDNFPRANTYWFRDWFYPIYANHGGTALLNNYFVLLAQYFPKNGNDYARDMNWGEFIHFWSGAANANLKEQATLAFGWSDEREAQFVQAQLQFPFPYANPENNGNDITNLGGSVSGQYNDSPAAEGIANLIDNNSNTKYLTFHNAAWIQYTATGNFVVDRYSITSANDSPTRDPLNWTLQGSADGIAWTTIDTRNGEDFPNRFQKRVFTFANTTAYRYYRLNLTNNSGTVLQLAEVEFFNDITNLGGSVTSQYNDSPAAEGLANLIDNNNTTKFLTFHNAAWIQYNAPANAVVGSYSLTSANDSPERDPLSWTLQGSTNGTTWTTLDTRTGEDFAYRFQKRVFSFTNSTAYRYYRVNLTNNSGSTLQLAEVELYENGTAAAVTGNAAANISGVYPNPSTDNIAVKFEGSQATVAVTDAQGFQVIATKAVTSGQTLDLSHLKQGVYYVHLNVDGVQKTERLVKK